MPMPAGSFEILNVGGGSPLPVAEIANLCAAAAVDLGLPRPRVVTVEPDAGPYPDFGMDVSRARDRLGFTPHVGPAEGLAELVRAFA